MFHFVYKTTNLVNGKYYIGRHSTADLNDGYIGSGKKLKNAIKHHGRNNFQREILFFCETKEELFSKEKEIVDSMVVQDSNSYNLMEGGSGLFHLTKEHKEKISSSGKGRTWKWNEAQKQNLKDVWKKKKHPQTETMWINNGIDCKKIMSSDAIPDGWQKGNLKVPSGHNRGKVAYTNGNQRKYFFDTDNIPSDWWKVSKT